MILAAATVMTGVRLPTFDGKGIATVAVAEAASTTGRVPMWAYMKSGSGKLTTYTTNALNKSTGYIVPGDTNWAGWQEPILPLLDQIHRAVLTVLPQLPTGKLLYQAGPLTGIL